MLRDSEKGVTVVSPSPKTKTLETILVQSIAHLMSQLTQPSISLNCSVMAREIVITLSTFMRVGIIYEVKWNYL